jgi:tRNA-specific 2-thiouridylase
MKVFVGLSGGVDSAVAAARLIDAGHTVVGVFIKVWHPDWLVCNWEQERLDAMRVAATLRIPFLTCDAKAAYRDEVAAYFIREYTAGRTPNPDVMCNRAVKFGAFLQFAKAHKADAIATGHYAQRIDTVHGPQLVRGVDATKDQSYFLWSLRGEQLGCALFPVGNTPKADIRVEATRRGLPVAQKRDSQGICFLGHIDIKTFLSHYTTLIPGDVLNTQGTPIGRHDSALIYTLGQRHGFTVTGCGPNSAPHYVVDRDISHNTITVAQEPPIIAASSVLTLTDIVLRTPISTGTKLTAETRYHQRQPHTVTVTAVHADHLTLVTDTVGEAVSSGQSCVLYAGNTCVGGGIIG